jgi:tRNA A-37 threonylcarbamoyl transferase component Bud32
VYCPKCRAEYPADWKACPKDATALLTSARIGKYTVDGILGVGGMGAVYKASNPDTKGRVAIKVMNPEVATAEQMRLRFQREAAAVAALRTSHVVKVYDFGSEPDGRLYLVMELLDGHALREEVHPEPHAMDLARVQMVMDGALKGLAAAHKVGIVHRDLKPENIFVADTDDGEIPKLLDFGIARVRTQGQDLTRTGSLMGTAPYMATEQVGAGGEVGTWTDVYAMGAILYELLAGLPAFGGDSITDVLQKVLKNDVVPLQTIRKGLPDAVYALVTRCLDPDPAKRPHDAEHLRKELAAAKLVPAGAAVPPASKTKRTAIAVAETEGRDTPLPPAPPMRSEIRSVAGERMTVPEPKRPVWPFLAAGVVLVGAGVLAAVKMLEKGEAAAPVVVVAIDATPIPIDAPPIDAPDPYAGMTKIDAGTYAIGEIKPTVADSLQRQQVTLRTFHIDLDEGAQRFVDFATADAACKALGKRLPTEAEWEVAALTTPQDSKKARLRRTDSDADLTAPTEDCSAAGLCNMLGGLIEWTATDWPKKRRHKVARGASYRTPADGQLDSIHARIALPVDAKENEVGFRCVKD